MSKKTFSMVSISAGDEDGAGGRAISSLKTERETDELVITRRRLAQVEPLDDDDVPAEQCAMRAMVPGMELLNGEIIHADKLDSDVYQILRAVGGDVRVVGKELRLLE